MDQIAGLCFRAAVILGREPEELWETPIPVIHARLSDHLQWYSLGILHRNYAFAGGKDTMSKVAAQLSKYLAPEPGGRATAESIDRLEAELENNPAWANYAAN